MKNLYNYYLLFIVLFTLSIKWFLSISEFGLNLNSLLLHNLTDIQYFQLVYSLSDFNFSPTYLENINADKIISFPLLGGLIHSFLFSLIGIYSFIILEYFFQIIFLIVVFITFIKVFEEHRKSFYFLIYLMLSSSIIALLSIYQDNIVFQNLHSLLQNNLGTRFPRPLITGVLIFLAIYYILDFQHQLSKSFDNAYIVKISIVLSLLLNTFFYYFIIFSILLIIIISININKRLFSKIVFKKLILFLTIFLVFASPFIFQQIYSEPDHSIRLGLIQIDNDKKYFLLSYFLKELISLKFSSIMIVAFLFFYYSNNYLKKEYKKINIFFYIILSSILSTIVFVTFSPSIISVYHLLDIIIFSLFFYLLIAFFSIIYEFIKKSKFSKNLINDKIIFVPILFFLILHSIYEVNDFSKKKESIRETIKLEKFLDDKKIYNTKYKLFTNDRIATNIWLLKKNNNLLISDGFNNSLKNSQIEYNLINSLKHFGFSEKKFKSFISLGRTEVRNSLFLGLFVYRYQANSLYTYSDLEYYSNDLQDRIKNTSPFRAQSQIMPENEKKRLLDLFENHIINNDLTADYVIINYSSISKHFEILNDEYDEIFSSKNYKIFSSLFTK